MSKYVVSALYHFALLDNFEELQQPLLKIMKQNNVKGTLLRRIGAHPNINKVKELGGLTNQRQMTIGNGIKTAGVNGLSAYLF